MEIARSELGIVRENLEKAKAVAVLDSERVMTLHVALEESKGESAESFWHQLQHCSGLDSSVASWC